MKKTIIAITGRTAAGKSVVAKKMAERLGLKVLQSYTTRQPRPDELADMEHSDHIFISNEEYDKLQDIAAETEINGCRYCTTVEALNQCDFYVIDPDGIDYLKKEHGKEFHIVQFYIYANDKIRKKRFLQRGNAESDFESRNADESKQFNAYEQDHKYDIIIYNNRDIDYALNMMEPYIKIILEDRLKEIEAKKNGTWVEPQVEKSESDKSEEKPAEDDEALSAEAEDGALNKEHSAISMESVGSKETEQKEADDAASPQGLTNDDEVGVQSADGVSDSYVRIQLPPDRRANKFDRSFPSVDDPFSLDEDSADVLDSFDNKCSDAESSSTEEGLEAESEVRKNNEEDKLLKTNDGNLDPFSLDDTDFDDSTANLDPLPDSGLDSAMNMASYTDNETKSSESKQPLEAKMSENSDTECKQTEEVSADTDIYGEEDDEDEEDAILLD